MLKEIYYLIKDRTLFYFSLSSGFSTFAYSLLVYYFLLLWIYLILAHFQNASKIKIGNATGYLKEVSNHVYGITNSQQVLQECRNLKYICPAFPIRVTVLIDSENYSAEVLGIKYFALMS